MTTSQQCSMSTGASKVSRKSRSKLKSTILVVMSTSASTERSSTRTPTASWYASPASNRRAWRTLRAGRQRSGKSRPKSQSHSSWPSLTSRRLLIMPSPSKTWNPRRMKWVPPCLLEPAQRSGRISMFIKRSTGCSQPPTPISTSLNDWRQLVGPTPS